MPLGTHQDPLTTVKRPEGEVVRTCLPSIQPGKDHLARHCEGKREQAEDKGSDGKTTSDFPESHRTVEDKLLETEMEAAGCEINGAISSVV